MEGDLSQLSHRLSGPRRTQAQSLDIRRILTCGFGFWRTDRTNGIDLRIRRLGVRVPPSAPRSQAPTRSGEGPFVPVGAILGAMSVGSGPNSAWLMDVATARPDQRKLCTK